MSLKQGIGNAEYLKKRIPKNARYQHIKTRLDTGCSLTKYLEKVEDMKRNYRYRNDEIFKRLKVTTFAQLILQVASVSELESSANQSQSSTPEDALSVVSEAELESLTVQSSGSMSPSNDRADARDSAPDSAPASAPNSARDSAPDSARSTLLSVISGVGELSVDRGPDPGSGPDCDRPYPDCPYLLLDVRDRDQYESCHIISAHSFPIASLSRTMNPYSKEVLQYKNAVGKIIIVYDEDERIASQAATTMCQRGFENLFMLSGGLKVVAQKFPDGSLVTGSLPPQCVSPSGRDKGRRTAPPVVRTQAEQRWRFSTERLNRIQERLDLTALTSANGSRVSSRSSSISLQSKSSSARSRQSSSSSSSRPWK